MTTRFALPLIALVFLTGCGGQVEPSNNAGEADLAATPTVPDGGSAAPKAAQQPFFDPAWLSGLPKADDDLINNIRWTMFLAKNNNQMQENIPFRYFVAALYSCEEATRASQNEFDRDKILNDSMQKLQTFLASQPDTFSYISKDDLGSWDRKTQTFTWSHYNNATFTPTLPLIRYTIPCNDFAPFHQGISPGIFIPVRNKKEIEARLPRVKMDENAARSFADQNPERKVNVEYVLQSTSDWQRFISFSSARNTILPLVKEVKVTNPADGATLSEVKF